MLPCHVDGIIVAGNCHSGKGLTRPNDQETMIENQMGSCKLAKCN